MKLSTKTSTFHSTLSLSFCGKLSWIYGVSSTNKYLADFFKKTHPFKLLCMYDAHFKFVCADTVELFEEEHIFVLKVVLFNIRGKNVLY